MYTLLILAVLTSMLSGILSVTDSYSSLSAGLQANHSSVFGGVTKEKHLLSVPDIMEPETKLEQIQKVIKRRSINLPDPDKPKFNQLLKVHRSRFLEVTEDGRVTTTMESNSVYSKLEVHFMCQLHPEQFRACSPSLGGQSEDRSQGRSVYSSILLRFTETNRYLCMDDKANIYTKIAAVNRESLDVSECVFEHDFLPNQYDVYSSQKYPRNSARCLLVNQSHEPVRWHERRFCEKYWFLGVSRKAEVLTIKAAKTPNKKAFFIQRWVHDQPAQTSPQFDANLLREAKHPAGSHYQPNGSTVTNTKISPSSHPSSMKPRRPVYRFLMKLSPSFLKHRRLGRKKTGCGNLLINCDYERKRFKHLDLKLLERKKRKHKSKLP